MGKCKNVQIPLELLYDLFRVHLFNQADKDTLERVQRALEGKLDAMLKHELYTASKTADTVEKREQARLEYLKKIGMHHDFRW